MHTQPQKINTMKKLIFPFAIAACMMLSAFTFITSTSWKIANNYSIKFTSKDPSGVFTALKGDVVFDENNLAGSKFDLTIDPASINTGSGMQNKIAKNEKWFNVAKYPVIKFTSTKIGKTATGYEVTGIMDMHGVQKSMTFPFTFKDNTFNASFDVNRTDFNIGGTTGMDAHAATVLKVDASIPVTR